MSDDPGMAVRCGTCNAKPDKPCRDYITGKVMDQPHGSRTWDAMLTGARIRWRAV